MFSFFKVGKSTVAKCVKRVTNSIIKQTNDFIYMPTLDEAKKIESKFRKISHIPQIIGVIDGTHIPVLAPREGFGDFVNRKGWTSFNTQVVVDVNYM